MPNVFPDDILARIRALETELTALKVATGFPLKIFESTHGDPNGTIQGSVGALLLETTAPALWQNTDGQAAWSEVGAGSSGYWHLANASDSLQIDPASTPGLHEFYMFLNANENTYLYVSDYGTGPSSILFDLLSEGSMSLTAATGMDITSGSTMSFFTSTAGDIQFDTTSGSVNVNTHGQDIWLTPGAGVIRLDGPSIETYDSPAFGAYLQFAERTAPAAPGADRVRIYAEDNGGGKTRLMARFNTGAAQQIAIEP